MVTRQILVFTPTPNEYAAVSRHLGGAIFNNFRVQVVESGPGAVNAAFKAAESIGYPECQLHLSQAAIYMALAPKSNSATTAIYAALSEVRNGPLRAVPNHLRDRHRPGAEDYAKYRYPHSDPRGWLDQHYLPDGLERGAFFKPGERGWESYRTDSVTRDRPRTSNEPQ